MTTGGDDAHDAGRRRPPGEHLDATTGDQEQHQERPDQRRRRGAEHRVDEPPRSLAANRPRPSPARPEQSPAGVEGDRGDRCARTGAGPPNPARRRLRQKHDGERGDDHHARHDEPEAARHRSPNPAEAASEVNRELRRGGPGEEVAGAIAASTSASLSQPRSSTTSRRSRAMCVGGPPKPVSPIRVHSRAIVAIGTEAGRPEVAARSRLDGQAGGDTLERRTLKPVGGPLLKTLGAERGVEVERGRVPGERRPFKASAPARDGKVREMGEQLARSRRAGARAARTDPPGRCPVGRATWRTS